MSATRENDDKKICFITAVNDEEQYAVCLRALKALKVPEGMTAEYIAVRGAASMTAAYQEAMLASTAKYKIYLHQDIECLNRQMLRRLITLFRKYPEYGLLGVAGATRLSDKGVWYAGKFEDMIGAIDDDHDGVMQKYRWRTDGKDITEAEGVDGVFLATQYDVDWRTDIFKRWHFYDMSQSKEFQRRGYKVGVVTQKNVWCRHHSGEASLTGYDRERKLFKREYFWGSTEPGAAAGGRPLLTSIVILSYNTCQLTQLCIESIRRYTEPDTYEIIVVDNASKDESVDYLKAQKDIKCIFNQENAGFPKGCNQGIAVAEGTEILLLNSDTIVTPRWLANLRTALYSSEDVGAVSCVTNSCSNRQKIEINYTDTRQMELFADNYNRSDSQKWVPYFKLVGFCMLIKKNICDKIGGLDEIFSPGNFEDDDYSFRIKEAGYRLLLCRDTFIHHFGSSSFTKSRTEQEMIEKARRYNALLVKNRQYFCSKWQVGELYDGVDKIIINKLPDTVPAGARILHIGCSCGAGMFYLLEKYPGTECSGIAYDEGSARVAGWSFPVQVVHSGDEVFACLSGKYQMIIINGLEMLARDPEDYLMKLMSFVERRGAIYFMLGGENLVAERD